jgi:hypothetical protein
LRRRRKNSRLKTLMELDRYQGDRVCVGRSSVSPILSGSIYWGWQIYVYAVIRQLRARLAREGKPFATFRYSSGSVLRKRRRIDALDTVLFRNAAGTLPLVRS